MTNEAGLQFQNEPFGEGVPSERAKIEQARLAVTKLQMSAYGINIRDADEVDLLCNEILEALELMAKEKTNGE